MLQKRPRNVKKIEVFLGMIGVIYFFVIVALVIFLVRFLVARSIVAVTEDVSSKALPQAYDIQDAEMLLTR